MGRFGMPAVTSFRVGRPLESIVKDNTERPGGVPALNPITTRKYIVPIQMQGFLLALALVLSAPAAAWSVPPCDELLPSTTVGYLSVKNVEQFRENWNRTQFGQLLDDPAMEPFVEDMRRKARNKFDRVTEDLGLTLKDLGDVAGGEACIALVEPQPREAAVVVLADVSGHRTEAQALLEKIDRRQKERSSPHKVYDAGQIKLMAYQIPDRRDSTKTRQSVFFLHDDMLVAADHLGVAHAIAAAFESGHREDRLFRVPEFRAIMDRCGKELESGEPQVRWYVSPFRFVETYRVANPSREPRRGRDLIKILQSQGFSAIRGVGGFVDLYVDGKFELIHRTSVYAPPVQQADGSDDRYTLAARMLRFPNRGTLLPPTWLPREVAAFANCNWQMQRAFDASETLVDALIGEEGSFQEVLDGIREDPVGPQIDLRSELVGHLGEQAMMITDYALPITPESERMLVALATTDEKALARAIERIMKSDPNAVRHEFAGVTVWEIVEEPSEMPELTIESPILDPLAADLYEDADDMDDADGDKKGLPSSAVCVANGHLLVATHFNFLVKVLVTAEERQTLAGCDDFGLVAKQMESIGPKNISFRFFSRTDEEYRAAYELIRQGRMPEARSLLGRILNAILGEGDEDVLRKQRIDGSKLPDFEMIRRYFGPAGVTITSEDDGWFAVGFMLNKQAL